jgi:hypothetical protein
MNRTDEEYEKKINEGAMIFPMANINQLKYFIEKIDQF